MCIRDSCYAHQLNLLLEKATSVNNKEFFLKSVCHSINFFTPISTNGRFGGRSATQVTPSFYTTRWNYKFCTVNVVYENRYKLEECFKVLEEKCTNKLTVNEASGHRRGLQDQYFMFWLTIFHRILHHVYCVHTVPTTTE